MKHLRVFNFAIRLITIYPTFPTHQTFKNFYIDVQKSHSCKKWREIPRWKRNCKEKEKFTLECSSDWGATCSRNRIAIGQVSTFRSLLSLFVLPRARCDARTETTMELSKLRGEVENGKHGWLGPKETSRRSRRIAARLHEISKNTELPAKTLPARLLFPCHRAPSLGEPADPFQVSNSSFSKFRFILSISNFPIVRFSWIYRIKVTFIKVDRMDNEKSLRDRDVQTKSWLLIAQTCRLWSKKVSR